MTILNIMIRRLGMRVFRIFNDRLCASLVAILVLSPTIAVAQWREIKPLRWKRADVIRSLGQPSVARPDYSVYRLEKETVSIEYASSSCRTRQAVWNVPIGTVTRFWVKPKRPLPLIGLQLDQSRFKKRIDRELSYIFYLKNEEEGVEYSIDDSSGLVTMIEYFPPASLNNLKCRSSQ